MLYFIYGNNQDKARNKAHEIIEIMKQKRPLAEFGKVDPESFSNEYLNSLISTQGLFEKKNIIFFDGVLGSKAENKESIIEKLKELKESENAFIFLEPGATKELLKKVEKHAEKVFSFETDAEKKKDNSIFNLADALGRKDRKTLWVGIVNAVEKGVPAEEIHGILFWQVKSMIIAQDSKSAVESGLNPYVFSKSNTFAKNFTKEELKNISSNLVRMYHEAHRGNLDFEVALEKFALDL